MDRLLATKSKAVGLIVRAISFQDFQPMWSQSTNVTDRQTDRQTDRRHAIPRIIIHTVYCGYSACIGSENHCETTKSLQICFYLTLSLPSRTLRLLIVLLESGVSVYLLPYVLEADIFSTGLSKDCVMWHIRQWLFWEALTVSHVCCYSYSVDHSKAHLITALMAQSDTSNFPR